MKLYRYLLFTVFLVTALLMAGQQLLAQSSTGIVNLCQGKTAILSVPGGYSYYEWSNGVKGAQATSITVSTAGLYTVTVTDANGCQTTAAAIQVNVVPYPVINLPASIEQSGSALLDAGAFDNASYRWSTSETTQQISVTQSGLYWVEVTQNGCTSRDSVQVNILEICSPPVRLGRDTTVACQHVLAAPLGYDKYIWYQQIQNTAPRIIDSVSHIILVKTSALYWVIAKRGTCTVSDTIQVNVRDTEQLRVAFPVYYMENVLAASAVTYSDQWMTDFNTTRSGSSETNISTLQQAPPYFSGAQGVWRPQSSFAYVTNRSQSTPVNLAKDGVFKLKMFDWKYQGELYCPEWRKTSSMTQYSPYSYELENRDILGFYSSALYGYNGKLSVAVAANAAYTEVGYEGFEEYASNVSSVLSSNVSNGNLDLFTSSAPGLLNSHRWIPLLKGQDNKVFTDGRLEKLPATTVNLKITGIPASSSAASLMTNVKVLSCEPKSEYSLLTLDKSSMSKSLGYWTGSLGIDTLMQPRVFLSGSNSVQLASKAHTGVRSLRVSGKARFQQVRLHLEPGKRYVIGGWVSLQNEDQPDYRSPESMTSSNRLSIQAYFTREGEEDLSLVFEPQGEIIEGWQRIEGFFYVPNNAKEFYIVLSNGGQVAFFDDLRLFPFNGNIQSYVYDLQNYKLRAVLDNNNYATFYSYDEQGNLFLTRKETERGIQTIQEAVGHSAVKE